MGVIPTIRRTPALRKAAILGLVLLAATLAFGRSSIMPPPAPATPATAFLIYDALHKGLILPEPDGTWSEWGFGDWDWYAQNRDRWYHVFDTVLIPTRGTLGRRDLGPGTESEILAIHDQVPIAAIEVESERLRELRDALWSEFRSGSSTEHYNPRYDTHFVHSRRSYWFLHNCNDSIADWLRQLGCTVTRAPIRLDLELEPGDL
jgi:hypothetical protein